MDKLEEIIDYGEDTEIIIATQPSQPFENGIEGIMIINENLEGEIELEEDEQKA